MYQICVSNNLSVDYQIWPGWLHLAREDNQTCSSGSFSKTLKCRRGLGTKEHFVLNSAQGDFSVTWKCGKPEIHLLPSLNICFAESFLVGLCCLYTFLSVYYHLLHYLLFADLLLCWSFTCLLVCWFLFFCVFFFICSFLLVPWPFDIWGIFNHVRGFAMWLVHRAEDAQQMTTNLNL